MSTSDYTILVNSTDSFEDCWVPFFTLLKAYWPNCDKHIVLNTEYKEFSFQGLNIDCSKVGTFYKGRTRLPWGWCLKRCLEQIDTSLILYLQDDYFINSLVNVEQIDYFAEYLMSPNFSYQDSACIGLTYFGNHSPFGLTENELLWEVDHSAKYRLSLQAGLWKTKSLLKYIDNKDTGWDFEEAGSMRARRIRERFLTVNRHIFNPSNSIIPYAHTGIIKGKWNKDAVIELFAQHNIYIDFSIRGFYSPIPEVLDQSLTGRIRRKLVNANRRIKTAINLKIDAFRM